MNKGFTPRLLWGEKKNTHRILPEKGAGFTLIELTIYIAIVSVVLVLLTGFVWSIIQGSAKSARYREVQQNARFGMEKITRALRAGQNPSIFNVSDGVLYQNLIPLTSDRVTVTNLQFNPIANSYKIKLSVEYNEASVDLESTVSLTTLATVSCWGIDGSCDSSCQYSDYGSLAGYYTDPGCSDSCPQSGSFYIPSGACSEDGTGECYKMADFATEYTFCIQGLECGTGCWQFGGSCDSSCQYSDYGSLAGYYTDPGCSDSCPQSGSFYIPSGACSEDGTGECYKMADFATKYTSCDKGLECEGACNGTCTPCRELNQEQCKQQKGCNWRFIRCLGSCASCKGFSDSVSCKNQLGCSWQTTKWNWDLSGQQTGYSSYDFCSWLEGVEKWNWNLTNSQTGYSSYTACEWYAQ